MSGLRSSVRTRGCWQWEVFVIHVHGDEVGRVQFSGAYVTTMRGGNEDRAVWVSSLTNKKPLVVVKARVDVVWQVV